MLGNAPVISSAIIIYMISLSFDTNIFPDYSSEETIPLYYIS
jgi:hypothetical protein